MKIETIQEAVTYINNVKFLKKDLPKEQVKELASIVKDFVLSHGKKISHWGLNVQEAFIDMINYNMEGWG